MSLTKQQKNNLEITITKIASQASQEEKIEDSEAVMDIEGANEGVLTDLRNSTPLENPVFVAARTFQTVENRVINKDLGSGIIT